MSATLASNLRGVLERVDSSSAVHDHLGGLLELDTGLREALEHDLAGWAATFPAQTSTAARELLEAGGKRLRPTLAFLSAEAAGGRPGLARPLAVAVELIHTGTLLHDDVIDEGIERRGHAAAWTVFGNAAAVLSGDYCFFAAVDTLVGHGDLRLLDDAMRVARALAEGELLQLDRRGRLASPTEAEYLAIARRKTGALFSLATGGGARAAQAPAPVCEALSDFGTELGIAFQVVDDLLDLEGDEQQAGKALGRDLAEGTLTLPLVYALEEVRALRPEVEKVLDPSAARTPDERLELARSVLARVRASASPDRCRALARRYTERAVARLEALPASEARGRLEAIADGLLSRLG